jgi:hypothetical protein
MKITPDDEIVDQAWYWVKRPPLKAGGRIDLERGWTIMQAQVYTSPMGLLYSRSISWWEIMKDWETGHNEIAIVGPRIEEPEE